MTDDLPEDFRAALRKLAEVPARRATTSPTGVDLSEPSLPDDNPKTIYGEQKPKLSDTPTVALRLLGQVMSMGRAKYGRFNWRANAVSATVYYDAALRHLMAWFEGEDLDPESGLPHLAHAMACMTILLDARERGTLNDNRLSEEDRRVEG
jgi:hypothetical protein